MKAPETIEFSLEPLNIKENEFKTYMENYMKKVESK